MTYRTLGKRLQRVQALTALPDLSGRTAVVTGGTDGVGRALVDQLAAAGATVVFTARNRSKGERVRAEVRERSGNHAVDIADLDLASLDSVRAGAADILERCRTIDLLICNAAHQATGAARELTADGFEMTFGVNHIGHFLLVRELTERVRAGAPNRVVIVASEAHKRAKSGLDFDDLMLEKGKYRRTRAYNRSKLANILFARSLSRRLAHAPTTVNAVHPGSVDTPMLQSALTGRIGQRLYPALQRYLLITPDEAAAGILRVALDPMLEATSGRYFEVGKEKEPTQHAQDDDAAERLWMITENLIESAAD